MEKIALCSDVANMDKITQENYHIDGLVLMENAAYKAYSFLSKNLMKIDHSIVFLCGGGNNGGDGLVIARYAFENGYKNIKIYLLSNKLSSLCERQKQICESIGIVILNEKQNLTQSILNADLIIDAMFGTGFHGKVNTNYEQIINLVNEKKKNDCKVASVDIPSGIGDYSNFSEIKINADYTITFGLKKACLYVPENRKFCGEIVLENPGFPNIVIDSCLNFAKKIDTNDLNLPIIPSDSYKNTRGRIGVFGGSKQFPGAPILCSTAAFKTGAGKVTIFGGKELEKLIFNHPEFMFNEITDNLNLDLIDSVVCGPGWGVEDRQNILNLLMKSTLPIVIDADGLSLELKKRKENPIVITPHMGEYSKINKIGNNAIEFFDNLKKISKELNAVVVLKSHVTWICYSNELYVLDGMNPSAGVGGSGDILSGIIAELSSKLNPLEACIQGVLLHQKAYLSAKDKYGKWFTPIEFLNILGRVV